MVWLSWAYKRIKWVGGIIVAILAGLSFIAPIATKTAGGVGEVANLKRLQEQIAPELAAFKSSVELSMVLGNGLTLTNVEVFPAQMKFTYRIDDEDPMGWLKAYTDATPAGYVCNESAGFPYRLVTHGMTYMQDFHGNTADGRKVFRQFVNKPFECRGKPGFEFLTARR